MCECVNVRYEGLMQAVHDSQWLFTLQQKTIAINVMQEGHVVVFRLNARTQVNAAKRIKESVLFC